MLEQKILQHWNGRSYLLGTKVGHLDNGLNKAERFNDNSSARRFIRNLKASVSEWRNLASRQHDFNSWLKAQPRRAPEDFIAMLLERGRLSAYAFSSHPLNALQYQLTTVDHHHYRHRFVDPMVFAIEKWGKWGKWGKRCQFYTLQESQAYLALLDISEDKALHTLNVFNIPHATEKDKLAGLARALLEGKIFLIKEKVTNQASSDHSESNEEAILPKDIYIKAPPTVTHPTVNEVAPDNVPSEQHTHESITASLRIEAQKQVLLNAYAAGVPFCEVCQKETTEK